MKIDAKPKILIDSLTVKFTTTDKGEIIALHDINLKVMENEFLCIMGPSGCGKTTLLNIVAGLLMPTSGTAKIDGKIITEPGPDRAVVFQENAVFPWMTVEKNIEFSLNVRKNQKDKIKTVNHFMKLVHLEKFRNAWPKQLSGGMLKRVDIARAYVANPKVLLLDEPFGSLDVITKEYLQGELLKIWRNEPRTIIFITHDIEEALFLGDRVVIMTTNPGKIHCILEPNFPSDRTISIKTSSDFIKYRKDVRIIMKNEQKMKI